MVFERCICSSRNVSCLAVAKANITFLFVEKLDFFYSMDVSLW
jgi:hypothetical protein